MRRSAVEEYLNAPTAGYPRRAPPPPPDWAERVQQEGLRDYTVPEIRQAYGRTSAEFRQHEAQRAATAAQANDDLLRSYRERVGTNPTASFRSAAAPQEDQGRVPQPYAGVGIGAREDPGGGGGEERVPQEYAGAPGGRYNPYEGMAPPPGGGGGDEWDQANYPPAGTGPPRGPGGAPPPQPAPQPAPAPFENADEEEFVYEPAGFQQLPVTMALPPPYDSPEAIKATFGPLPRPITIKKAIGLAFHPDKGAPPQLFQNAVNAVNNAYGRYLIGKGKRRKYRY